MSYWLLDEAAQELSAAFEHYREHAGSRIAESFLAEFERAARLLVRHPGVGKPMRGDRRLLDHRRFPYCLIYRASPDGVRISAIAHQRRGPGYHRQVQTR